MIVYIPWDAKEYYEEHIKGGRDKKRIKFPNPQFGSFSSPLTVVDSKGRIVLWYLPGLLSDEEGVNLIFSITLKISPVRTDFNSTRNPKRLSSPKTFHKGTKT